MPVMAETAKFCRERQALCHRSEPVPQIAVLLSTAGHYRKIKSLFGRELSGLSGVLQALLESQNTVEVVSEHQLKGRLSDYPLIVVPEWAYLEQPFKKELVAYAKKGGNLLLVGPKCAALFQAELDVTLIGEPQANAQALAFNGGQAPLKGCTQGVSLGGSAEPFGTLRTADNAVGQPAASVTPLGQGKIAAAYADVGSSYNGVRSPVVRAFFNALVRKLFPEPMVEVSGSPFVDVCLMRKEGNLLVNLVNTSGPHQTAPIQTAIEPVGPLAVTLRLPSKPSGISLEPGGNRLDFAYADGTVKLTLPQIDIHQVLVVR